MSELIPLLMKKWIRQGGPLDFTLVHICRGIMKWVPLLRIPYQNPRHRSESINIGSLYDFMYVLEDRNVIDINKEFLGSDPELEQKIHYMGKITNRVYEELPPRREVLTRFGLPDKKIVLVSMGRNNRVTDLCTSLLNISGAIGLEQDHQVVMILDPYLPEAVVTCLRRLPLCNGVRFLPFVPDLVDLIYHSELVICRAGYNTINEILLTGAKAVIIPESHGGGEQELRARSVQQDNILVLTEDRILDGSSSGSILDLLNRPITPVLHKFDKYAIGKRMLQDLENWTGSPRTSCSS